MKFFFHIALCSLLFMSKLCIAQPNNFDDGSIICQTNLPHEMKNFELCTSANIPLIKGVYSKSIDRSYFINSDMVADVQSAITHAFSEAIISDGVVNIRYNTENGILKKGDFLTVSPSQQGVAAKATESGMIIGISLEDAPSGQKEGLLKMRVMIQYLKF